MCVCLGSRGTIWYHSGMKCLNYQVAGNLFWVEYFDDFVLGWDQ